MPYADVNDIKIYYEIHGSEESTPIVLIEGWGMSLWCWFRQLKTLSEKHKVIIFDNRGAGKSSKPDYAYSAEMLADDAKKLLDFLGIEKAHIFGNSMGGMIAQQFAISYPEKVLGLILASTSFGEANPNIIQRTNKTLAAMFAMPTETISQEQAMDIKRNVSYSQNFLINNKTLSKQIEKWILENPQPIYALVQQSQVAPNFDSEEKIGKVTLPTLILHGDDDLIIPPENAELLLNKIPNSRLILFKEGPHRVEIERHNDYNEAILNFIDEVDKGRYKPEPKKVII